MGANPAYRGRPEHVGYGSGKRGRRKFRIKNPAAPDWEGRRDGNDLVVNMNIPMNTAAATEQRMTAEAIARECGKASRTQHGWKCRCPAHDDTTPSLSLADKAGKVVLYCHAGCSQTRVIEALRSRNLWPAAREQKTIRPVPGNGVQPAPKGKPVAEYEYRDRAGAVLFRKLRYPGKRFQVVGMEGQDPVPYRLPEFPRPGSQLLIVEGEKDADAAAALGFAATTSHADWPASDDYARHFAGLRCVVIPDNDAPGRKRARKAADAVASVAASVHRLELPDLPPGGDLSDWVDAGGDADQLRELLTRARLVQGIELDSYAKVRPRSVEWLIPGWIPRGAISLLAGPPGVGKSTLAWTVAARVSAGGTWPGGGPIRAGTVAIWAGEDDSSRVVRPALEAAGAKLDRCARIEAAVEGGRRVPFSPAEHLPRLAAQLPADCRLLVIDPALALAEKSRDEYRAGDIRRALAPLADLCEQRGIAALCVAHFLKRHNSSGSGALDRIAGSGAWGQVARSVMVADHMPEEGQGRVLARAKSSYADTSSGSILYQLEPTDTANGVPTRRVAFGARVDGDADSILGTGNDQAERVAAPAREEAVAFLRGAFGGSRTPRTWAEVMKEGKGQGLTVRMLREARITLRKDGEIRTWREPIEAGGHRWLWQATPQLRANDDE